MATQINAKIVTDSTCNGHRITTMLLTYPRFIHSEMCRHRMQSRNTASSRAIPLKKMIEAIQTDPVIPIAWQKQHAGMQGTEYFPLDGFTAKEGVSAQHLNDMWLSARDVAIKQALEYEKLNVTKQLINRLLEPWMWTVELVTATEWENFFHLRCPQYQIGQSPVFGSRKDCLEYFSDDPDLYQTLSQNTEVEWLQINKGQAEIHMMALAEAMWDARNESTPRELQPGQWHIPFYTDEMWSKVADLDMSASFEAREKSLIQIATAKAAQTSYTIVGEDGKETPYSKLIDLHDRLLASGHMSPFEHCAQAMTYNEFQENVKGVGRMVPSEAGIDTDNLGFSNEAHGWCHNLRGWRSYRSMIPNENRQ